ncbi:MAG: RNA methyltransferase [Rhodobacterales bacterium]|nr:MAG: RNA methyltransferase [Rhodobacterales bacterium]
MENDIFLAGTPGAEQQLYDEARRFALPGARRVPGGVEICGDWETLWRANLGLRGATRVLLRIGSFMAFHPAQLDKRARKFPWGDWLRADVPVRVETVTRKSKIYHAGAATSRIEKAITDTLGAPIAKDAPVVLKVRIDDNRVTLSIDTSGESLHKRGHKVATGKAPMRETLAALFLAQMGFDGNVPVYDPMCGSGTFPIEAAEIAAGLWPGRSRSFAFEQLAGFDAKAYAKFRAGIPAPRVPQVRFYGSDRDDGAIRNATANAERSGVADFTTFHRAAISDITPPDGPPGIVMINPPYGTRIGNKGALYALHKSMGEVLAERFKGWRVGIITSETGLARATALPFQPPGPPIPHGGLKVRLFQTGPL